MAVNLTRKEYVDLYGPTAGDKLHLGDTGLIIEIEKDFNAESYGDEAVFGGGKTLWVRHREWIRRMEPWIL